jgi:CheY-like chemotaxis protein
MKRTAATERDMNPIVSMEARPGKARTATILIAEDHVDSRDALEALLLASGFAVVLARNGREAVDQAVAHRPDLILMDIMMPEVDGFEAMRRIRNDARMGAVPIIAVTAMEGAHPRALEAGADDCVRKPLEIRGLLEKVRDRLAAA